MQIFFSYSVVCFLIFLTMSLRYTKYFIFLVICFLSKSLSLWSPVYLVFFFAVQALGIICKNQLPSQWQKNLHMISSKIFIFFTCYINISLKFICSVCPTLCDPTDCSMSGFPAQTYVHWVGNAIQISHRLSSFTPPAFDLSQHQGLFQWVSSLH